VEGIQRNDKFKRFTLRSKIERIVSLLNDKIYSYEWT
jgi:hypothetical protein